MGMEKEENKRPEVEEGRSFEEILQECVEGAFIELYGPIGTRILFYYLWRSFGGNPTEARSFSQVLHGFLDNSAIAVEKAIVGRLCRELSLEFRDSGDFDFNRCIEEARRAYEGRKGKGKGKEKGGARA
ncbi:hypothetical protein KEJ19_06210 [Candidatus Bathyarchaeota archaeon]|nr:hypothetical protein [Candidatus Bathyarchaeota archaeon]